MSVRKAFQILIVLFILGAFFTINVLSSALPGPDLVQALRQETGDNVRISYHSETGKVRFIGTDPAHPMAQPAALAVEATPETAALNFLATYGPLFGLTEPAQELSVMRTRTMDAGRSMVRFQQTYQGIQVLGGELIVNMDATRNVLSASGEVLPDIQVNTVPVVDAEVARQTALEKIAKDNDLSVDDLVATQPELWIYNPVLLGGTGPRITSLVWRMDVQAKELLPIRELVLVEAHLGFVVLHFNQIDTIKTRTVYDNNNVRSEDLSLNAPVCTELGGCSGAGTTDDDFAYDFAGDTYNFYFNNHARDSLDGDGMGLTSTVRYCPANPADGSCPYGNAFWNGEQMVYGQDFASADDVVGHEMTHGVTDHESRLFYYMQSGAINESFSDIWGEFIDQANGYNGPGGSNLWEVGEDLPLGGALRSMSDPPNPPNINEPPSPDRMGSPYYYCSNDDLGNDDMGGVHLNSGVGNKAAYLMAAGGSFNGYVVSALGITKTAKIFYEVQTNLFTSASDYQDLYDGLQQACNTLVGTGVTTQPDCLEVKDAVDATQMNLQPGACATSHAPVCPEGQTANTLFFDNLESTGSGNWSSAIVSGGANHWYYPQYPNALGFDATYATSGETNFWGFDLWSVGDYAMSKTSNVSLPPGSNPYLRFEHAFGFEQGSFDGGVLEYSLDGGGWTDAGSLSPVNGYNGSISSPSNALNGRSGFVNNSNGYISTRYNLGSLAGHNVKFRFRLGADALIGDWGWFIDDIHIYTCSGAEPTDWVYLPLVMRLRLPPIAPSNLVAAATSSSAIHLTWTDNTNNEDGYNLERSPNGTTWSPLVTRPANSTSYDDTGLLANTLYYYRVKAYNGMGSSAYSNTASATTLPLTMPPAAPTNLVAATTSSSAIHLTWSDNANNEDGYNLERSPNGTTWSALVTLPANSNSYDNTGLPASTLYYYRVKAYNGAGSSAWSNTASATTLAAAPTAGLWQENTPGCEGCSEFYVTPNGAYVDNFGIGISVEGCGNFWITLINPEVPISSNQFSFTGSLYGSGTFESQTIAHGSYGLNNYYLAPCGFPVSGGPWDYTSSWIDATQPPPDFQEAIRVQAVDVNGAVSPNFHVVDVKR